MADGTPKKPSITLGNEVCNINASEPGSATKADGALVRLPVFVVDDVLKMTRFKPDPLLFTAQNFEVNSSYNRSSHGSIQISKIPISNEKSTGYDSPVLNSEVCWIIMYTAVNFSIFRTAYSMLLHMRFCSTAWP